MTIVTQEVTSFAAVVAFYETWRPYSIPALTPVAGLPPEWHGLPWRIDQREGAGTCYVMLKD